MILNISPRRQSSLWRVMILNISPRGQSSLWRVMILNISPRGQSSLWRTKFTPKGQTLTPGGKVDPWGHSHVVKNWPQGATGSRLQDGQNVFLVAQHISMEGIKQWSCLTRIYPKKNVSKVSQVSTRTINFHLNKVKAIYVFYVTEIATMAPEKRHSLKHTRSDCL
jgi:hypothetical protein